ncbi:hypothetical protein M0R45_030428 [Rubus argutus]|uniref:Uncharacterized protein n=1 Tax=Rubus argutus TaxID=59490 RepID=A0AAW1WDI1_RUBAR
MQQGWCVGFVNWCHWSAIATSTNHHPHLLHTARTIVNFTNSQTCKFHNPCPSHPSPFHQPGQTPSPISPSSSQSLIQIPTSALHHHYTSARAARCSKQSNTKPVLTIQSSHHSSHITISPWQNRNTSPPPSIPQPSSPQIITTPKYKPNPKSKQKPASPQNHHGLSTATLTVHSQSPWHARPIPAQPLPSPGSPMNLIVASSTASPRPVHTQVIHYAASPVLDLHRLSNPAVTCTTPS